MKIEEKRIRDAQQASHRQAERAKPKQTQQIQPRAFQHQMTKTKDKTGKHDVKTDRSKDFLDHELDGHKVVEAFQKAEEETSKEARKERKERKDDKDKDYRTGESGDDSHDTNRVEHRRVEAKHGSSSDGGSGGGAGAGTGGEDAQGGGSSSSSQQFSDGGGFQHADHLKQLARRFLEIKHQAPPFAMALSEAVSGSLKAQAESGQDTDLSQRKMQILDELLDSIEHGVHKSGEQVLAVKLAPHVFGGTTIEVKKNAHGGLDVKLLAPSAQEARELEALSSQITARLEAKGLVVASLEITAGLPVK